MTSKSNNNGPPAELDGMSIDLTIDLTRPGRAGRADTDGMRRQGAAAAAIGGSETGRISHLDMGMIKNECELGDC